MPFDVDTRELCRRVRKASGNPFVRAVRFQRVDIAPRDLSWWAGRAGRRATLYLSPMDHESLEWVRELHPAQHRRLVRLIADLLDVEQVRLERQADDGALAVLLGRIGSRIRSFRHEPIAELLEGAGVEQLQRPQLLD